MKKVKARMQVAAINDSCTTKEHWPSEGAALAAARAKRRRFHIISRPYECVLCSQWHLMRKKDEFAG